VLLRAIVKLCLEVPAAIENASDEHRIRRDDEGDGHAPLEPGHPQSGKGVVTLRSPQRKCGEPVAVIDDAADIAVRALLTRMLRDVLMGRANLFSDAEWEATRPIVCRTLGLPPDPQPILESMAVELDKTYREVARRLPDNPDVRFEKINGKEELILTPLDALEEPLSLIQLRKVVADRLPRAELAELVLEVALRTGFTEAFTQSDRSLCERRILP
jgi:hypothetical protein